MSLELLLLHVPMSRQGVTMDEYGMPVLSFQCAIEEIIDPIVPDGVMSKSDWHALCADNDCDCHAHDRE